MLYSIMLMGIGFLAACILMAMLAPLIHERAVRLTTVRNLAATPMSVVEMKAHKDQMRAEFAMTICRLEMSLAEMQGKTGEYLREIAKKAAEVYQLKTELRKTNIVILRFQGRELLRKSIMRRIVKLLIYMFVRSSRESEPQTPVPAFPGQAVVASPRLAMAFSSAPRNACVGASRSSAPARRISA
jgi:hypothetical protein